MSVCLSHKIPFIKKEKLRSAVEKFTEVSVQFKDIKPFPKPRTGKEMLVASVTSGRVEEIRNYLGLPIVPEAFKPHVTLVEHPMTK